MIGITNSFCESWVMNDLCLYSEHITHSNETIVPKYRHACNVITFLPSESYAGIACIWWKVVELSLMKGFGDMTFMILCEYILYELIFCNHTLYDHILPKIKRPCYLLVEFFGSVVHTQAKI